MTSALDYLQGTRQGFKNSILAALTDNERNDAINDAKLEVSEESFGDSYQMALALLAAENIIVAASTATTGGKMAGAVIEGQDGDVKTRYSDPNALKKPGAITFHTQFGERFARIRDTVASDFIAVWI